MSDTRHEPLDKTYDPSAIEATLYSAWENDGCFKAGRVPEAEPYHCYSAAQCDRQPAYGPRTEQHIAGYSVPL